MEEKIIEGISVRKVPLYGHYWISSHGSVWSDFGRAGWLKLCRRHKYVAVNLTSNGVSKSTDVHRLVAICWIGPAPADKPLVLHKDDDKENNCCLNLYYGDGLDNARDRVKNGLSAAGERNHKAKLTAEQVLEIKRRLSAREKGVVLAKEFGISPDVISRIKKGDIWKTVLSTVEQF